MRRGLIPSITTVIKPIHIFDPLATGPISSADYIEDEWSPPAPLGLMRTAIRSLKRDGYLCNVRKHQAQNSGGQSLSEMRERILEKGLVAKTSQSP